jgi:hypothetical protein
MDALVAQYSRPMFQPEAPADLEELRQEEAPALNLKFAVPPIAQVSKMLSNLQEGPG